MIDIFLESKPLIAMIHLPPIRQTPMAELIGYALSELRKIEEAGFDAIMVENFQDTPFHKDTIPEELIIKLSVVMHRIKEETDLPVGLNLLRNACVQAMRMASALNLDFIRCNIWESAYTTDQGLIEAAAYDVMQCKQAMGSEVLVLADIFVKHATPMADFTVIEAAENALERGKADMIILSGRGTGQETDISRIVELNKHGIFPLIGSGLTYENLCDYYPLISGALVGSSIKIEGIVTNPIDIDRASNLVSSWKSQ